MHVTVIAKSPVPGLVKSRLCPPCTHEQAAAIATAALAETFEALDLVRDVVDGAPVKRHLLLEGESQSWMPDRYVPVVQRGDGLDERLRNGFADLGAGAIIGMDTPHVAHLLDQALDWLTQGYDVLGPAEDGGYWMIGISEATLVHLDEVFRDIPMSDSTTGRVQLERLTDLGRRVEMLSAARDLDTFDDLVAVARSGRGGRLVELAAATVDAVAR